MGGRWRQPDGSAYKSSDSNTCSIWFFYGKAGGDDSGEDRRNGRYDLTVTDSLLLMYEDALDAGIDPVSFWDYSPGEILDLLDSYERRRKHEAREKVSRMFIHAQIIRRYMFPPEGDKPPTPWEYYPDLFEEEQDSYEQNAKEQELIRLKNSRQAYYQEFNKRRKMMENQDGK